MLYRIYILTLSITAASILLVSNLSGAYSSEPSQIRISFAGKRSQRLRSSCDTSKMLAPDSAMSTSTILYHLAPFRAMLEPIAALAKKEHPLELLTEVHQEYNSIQLRWYIKNAEGDAEERYAECTFMIEAEGKIILKEVFCESRSTQNEIERYLKQYMNKTQLHWSVETPVVQENMYYGPQLLSLYYADQIAQEGFECDQSYAPGYYSEIVITEKQIELYQNNRRNSRLIDKKDSYIMRDIKFIIPLAETAIPEYLYQYKIENLYINFRDNSSPQNKECGDRIMAKIIALTEK